MSRVAIEHLTKTFPGPRGEIIRALSDFNLVTQERELLVLVGASGCGKTTTLRLIAGLEEPDAGNISIDGWLVNGVPPKDRDIAMVFQNAALYPHLSAYDNMAVGLKLRHSSRAEIEQRVCEAAEMLGLRDCLERLPMELSGGQRQRVALGRAIVRRPKIFLFDEPLSNLDAQTRSQLRAEISRLHKQLGSTFIHVTHDQVEGMALGNRIAVMREGVLQQVDSPVKLYQNPANLFVAGFIGSPRMNFFEGTILAQATALCFVPRDAKEDTAARGLALRINPEVENALRPWRGKPVICGIRPEHIAIKNPASGDDARVIVEAVAEVIEHLGSDSYVHGEAAGHRFIARIPGAQHIALNEKIPFVFAMEQAHFFDPLTEKPLCGS